MFKIIITVRLDIREVVQFWYLASRSSLWIDLCSYTVLRIGSNCIFVHVISIQNIENAYQSCLAKNILANVSRISIAKALWEKLEYMYQTKSLSKNFYLKELFHRLCMEEGTRISNHLSILNGMISYLYAIRVVISNEDKALRLIWYLPTSYEHVKPILIYWKHTVIYS